jgi:ABC-type siderophore export system fused ATPase/permease subunit
MPNQEVHMSAFWVMIIFWLGVVLGFGVFALMQVARDAGDKAQFEMDALSQAFHTKRRDRRSAAPEIRRHLAELAATH